MPTISDFDKNGEKLTKKEKQYAKDTLKVTGALLAFKFYYNLWKDGDKKQKRRMLISWLLFLPVIGITNDTGLLPDLAKAIYISLTILWLFIVPYSWYARWNEEKRDDGKENNVISNDSDWFNSGWVWFWMFFFFPIGIIGLIKRRRHKKNKVK